jgi:hypothetical protein
MGTAARFLLVGAWLAFAPAASAQMPPMRGMARDTAHAGSNPMHHGMPAGMVMPMGDGMHEMHAMHGLLGAYPQAREASGTSWQPEAAGHGGMHMMRGPWSVMFHGYADGVLDRQGGPRGGGKGYSDNMVMAEAQRGAGAATLGLRAMMSLEPATIGRTGYPLLLQTGETADGVHPLVDRQHPHDLFMELAGMLSLARGRASAFLYAGLPGEPALGPPAFMHRFSARDVPAAPITHHWLDSSHITWGVLSAGAIAGPVKLEASAFRGREPDEHRWDFETPKLDSHALRISWNPTASWALQASQGHLKSPESLEPDVDQDRTTFSAMRHFAGGEATLAWGRDRNHPGHTLDAWLAEVALERGANVFFGRAERVAKDELFTAPDARAGSVFTVGEVTAGVRRDFAPRGALVPGLGAAASLSIVPRALRGTYGDVPASGWLFGRVSIR